MEKNGFRLLFHSSQPVFFFSFLRRHRAAWHLIPATICFSREMDRPTMVVRHLPFRSLLAFLSLPRRLPFPTGLILLPLVAPSSVREESLGCVLSLPSLDDSSTPSLETPASVLLCHHLFSFQFHLRPPSPENETHPAAFSLGNGCAVALFLSLVAQTSCLRCLLSHSHQVSRLELWIWLGI